MIVPKVSSALPRQDCGIPKNLDFTGFCAGRTVGILKAKGKALAI
jgi:hypothetical protein